MTQAGDRCFAFHVMDPTEAFNAMMEAYAEGQYEDAADHANDLAEWLNKGGFPPPLRVSADGGTVFSISDQLAREFCWASCRMVLDQHEAGCDPQP